MENCRDMSCIAQIEVRTYTSGREGASQTTLDISPWDAQSLLSQAVKHFAAQSRLHPTSPQTVSRLRRAIACLSGRSAALVNRPFASLSRQEVHAILRCIDRDISRINDVSAVTARGMFWQLKSLLSGFPKKLRDGQTFRQAAASFSASITSRHFPQIPINPIPSQISQITHENLVELRRKAIAVLECRRSSIELAAKQEIENYETVHAFQRKLVETPPPRQLRTSLLKWIVLPTSKRDRHPFPRCTPEQFACVLLRHIALSPPTLDKHGWPVGLRLNSNALEPLPSFTAYRFQFCGWPWFEVQNRLPNSVLTAIFVLLLSHTGWNQAAIGELRIGSVERISGRGYRIQSYKSKTDDDTPAVDVPSHMQTLCKAIDLLLWNYGQLASKGLIDPSTEKRLWFGWQRDSFKCTTNVIADKRIAAWCTRHKIERFVPSELRPMKAALTYLPQRDLEAVRVLLGHQNLKTSDEYLESTLFFRLNEAMMLEFQRRIEATATYVEGDTALLLKRKLDRRYVDKGLLVPTGDGGACNDVFAGHPNDPKIPEAPCAGLSCQTGSGCDQYRLVVTPGTLEMAFRTRNYYQSRWLSIYDENPTAFVALHLPRIIYIHVLLDIVRQQRPDLYKQAKEKLL